MFRLLCQSHYYVYRVCLLQKGAEGMDVDVMDDEKSAGNVPKSPLKSPGIKLDPNLRYEDVEEYYVKYKN